MRIVLNIFYGLALLSMTETALACTVALKRGETTEEYRARHLKKAMVIRGNLLVAQGIPSSQNEVSGERIEGPEFGGTVTDEKGRSLTVTFHPPGLWLVDDTACGIFTLPTAQSAHGTFYLIREGGKAYHLLHYAPASEF